MTDRTPFFTLRRAGPGAFDILDQRALPNVERYVRLESAESTADAIRALAVRGAPAIGCAAAFGVSVEAYRCAGLPRADFARALDAGFAVLAASRPTAVNLFWALERMKRVRDLHRDADPASLAGLLDAEASAITEEDVAVNRRMGEIGATVVPEEATILTHCNAGALATAGHGTALGVIRSAVQAGKRVQVYADETRPVLQGARLTAWELHRDGIPVTLLPDGASGHLMTRRRVDLVVVGADRVAANGDVANKIGTYNLAVLARRHGVPFYVAAPLSTFDHSLATGASIPIEERDGAEVTGYGTESWAPEGIGVFNPAFDVTPAELITGLITEAGIVREPTSEKVAPLRGARPK
ncbi:MAG: S-methyl-5-thioribose-1-phosphate isomerase [Betaproteobacteria bacterium]|nr:S-methyl-5-thioribose-1-phosphate isomerase [Betaproteobacteria bacterium]